MPLDDDLMVYPNHGAGSACGKKMSKETTDTLGNQKKTNYALRADMTKEEFIKELLTGLTAPPNYFPKNVLLNIGGYKSFDKIMKQAAKALTPDEFELLANEEGALVLDTREADNYAKSHIPNSINIGLQGSFAPWVGEMIPDLETPILLITEVGKEEEAITRLSRVGYDNTQGYLADGMKSWEAAGKEVDTINRITAEELEQKMNQDIVIIDVRKKSEFDSEHIEGVVNVPLNQINQHLEKFPKEQEFVLHCAGGYRSMIAASILQQRGWSQLTDVIGGFKSIKETTIPVTAYVCPSTLL